MRSVRFLTACVGLALAWNQAQDASAQMSAPSMPSVSPIYLTQAPAGPQAPIRPAPQDPAAAPQAAPAFGEAAPAGTEATGGAYAPQMLGDSVAYFTNGINLNQSQLRQLLTTPGNALLGISGQQIALAQIFNIRNGLGVLQPQLVGLPGSVFALGSFSGGGIPTQATDNFGLATPIISLAASAFKVCDNESPRPQNRAYLNFDYITGINHGVREFDPADFGSQRIAREIFGYEHTFLDGDASLEFRVPFFQLHTGESINNAPQSFSDLGDITILTKFALVNDRDTGNCLTVGFALTLPTGPGQFVFDFIFNNAANTLLVVPSNVINPTIYQPYVGFVYFLSQDVYVHGFSEIAFNSQPDVVPTVLFNDIALGVYAYRDASMSIVPTVELHVTTPLNDHGLDAFPVGAPNQFITTLGAHLSWREADLTLGWAFPLSGPQPFSNEMIAQFNYRY